MFQCSIVFCPSTFFVDSPAFAAAACSTPVFCDVFAVYQKTTEHWNICPKPRNTWPPACSPKKPKCHIGTFPSPTPFHCSFVPFS